MTGWARGGGAASSRSFERKSVCPGVELGSAQVKARIWLTQAGDPLANGRGGFSHCVNDHRFVLAAVTSVTHGTDEQVSVAKFWVAQVFSEGAGDALRMAELDPVSKR